MDTTHEFQPGDVVRLPERSGLFELIHLEDLQGAFVDVVGEQTWWLVRKVDGSEELITVESTFTLEV